MPSTERKSKSPALRDLAYRRLRDEILSGRLAAGARVRERELAERLGMSTTPVKEALRRLETEALILTVPRRGTFVTNFSFDAFKETILVRAAMEGAVARLAALKITDEGRAALRDSLRAMRAAVLAADTERFLGENEKFHDVLHALAANPYLERLVQGVRLYADVVRRQLLPQTGDFRATLRDHKDIIEAVVAGDELEAESAMRRHVERGLRRFVSATSAAKPARVRRRK